MGDIKLFRLDNEKVTELPGTSVALEKSLQERIEKNLETFMGVRFLASEYSTGPVHGGRIDTLGIDENGSPVIIEYKRATNENVINQGLFYLDWLMDHQGEFKWLVQEKYSELVETIEWSSPRLICIAGGFTKYDLNAVSQINRIIELHRYVRYGDDLLLLDWVNAAAVASKASSSKSLAVSPGEKSYKGFVEYLAQADQELKDLYEQLCEELRALGDDVQEKQLLYYRAFKRLKNFACVEVKPTGQKILVYVKGNPDALDLEEGFSRDVRTIGHFGTGEVELTIASTSDLQKALPLIEQSYAAS